MGQEEVAKTMNKNSLYYRFLCAGGWRHPLKAVRVLRQRARIRKMSVGVMKAIFEEATNPNIGFRVSGETDEQLRDRIAARVHNAIKDC
jgi:hypothetical protein